MSAPIYVTIRPRLVRYYLSALVFVAWLSGRTPDEEKVCRFLTRWGLVIGYEAE